MLVMGRHLNRPRRATARGLTLIELLIVVVLLALLSAVAAPSLGAFTANQRVKALTLDLTSDLLFARSEALKRNATVTLAPRSTSDWNAGWTVSAGGTVLLSREALPASVAFSNTPNAISFNAQGRVSAPTGAVRVGLAAVSGSQINRCVELDLSGRARSKAEACS